MEDRTDKQLRTSPCFTVLDTEDIRPDPSRSLRRCDTAVFVRGLCLQSNKFITTALIGNEHRTVFLRLACRLKGSTPFVVAISHVLLVYLGLKLFSNIPATAAFSMSCHKVVYIYS